MKKTKHSHCISNFLLGLGSILNIAPTVATTPILETGSDDYQYVNEAWKETGQHLRNALENKVDY